MHVFVSYDPADAAVSAWVQQLSQQMSPAGLRAVSINLSMMLEDTRWVHDHLHEEVGHCSKVLVVLSKSYLANDWMLRELDAFHVVEAKFYRHRSWLIPVVVDDSHVPPYFTCPPLSVDLGQPDSHAAVVRHLVRPTHAFFVMPFNVPAVDAMYAVARDVFDQAGLVSCRIDEVHDAGAIMDQIVGRVVESDLVFVDFTDDRPNCYYEAGLADALRKEVIFAAQYGTRPHFDLRHRRMIFWHQEDLRTFRSDLEKHVGSVLARLTGVSPPPLPPLPPPIAPPVKQEPRPAVVGDKGRSVRERPPKGEPGTAARRTAAEAERA